MRQGGLVYQAIYGKMKREYSRIDEAYSEVSSRNCPPLLYRFNPHYDNSERVAVAKIISDRIRADVTNSKDKTAIDFGCGTGLVGLGLLDIFRRFYCM